MIYCVWYPSGGFGHYVNAVISLYGKNFCRPKNRLGFSNTGDSHSLDLAVPRYFKDPPEYDFKFDSDKNYSVLIDNGITNEGTKFKSFFPTATTIKLGYSDWSWPVLAKTMIIKAMNQNFESELSLDSDRWESCDNWAQREKYFLYLRDHKLRYSWRPGDDLFIDVLDIFDYNLFKQLLLNYGIETDNFEEQHRDFSNSNQQYVKPIVEAKHILQNLKNNLELTTTDIWTQSLVYYYIWLKYNVEVPHNDYSNWFTTTDDIVKMLDHYGVDIDSN